MYEAPIICLYIHTWKSWILIKYEMEYNIEYKVENEIKYNANTCAFLSSKIKNVEM